MNTYFKILFVGVSLSVALAACENDSTSNETEGMEQATEVVTTQPVKEIAEASVDNTNSTEASIKAEEKKIEEERIEAEKLEEAKKVKAEALVLKEKKEKEASEKRRKKRREKRRVERERKKLAAENAKKETLPVEVNLKTPVEEPKIVESTPLPTTIPSSGSPSISFNQQLHNYGTIHQGDEVTHKFKFKNTGNSELVISNVTASCGCTHPSYPFIPLGPGEEGYIGVHFDSAGRLGKQKPTITVYTNAQPQSYELFLEGYVDSGDRDEKIEKDSL